MMMMGRLNTQQKRWLDGVKEKPIMYGLENGFEDLREVHNNWIKLFLFSEEDLTLQAHRGSYKTTCLSIAIALMIIVFPWLNILFMRKTDEDVKEIIRQVGKLLRTDLYKGLAKVLWGKDLILNIESAFEIDTNLKKNARGTSQLLGVGHKGSLTGKHFDIVITDDIVNINDRISRADRERTKITYQELQNIKNRGGRIINTGTPWHKEDAFSLMPNPIKYDCYSTGLMGSEEIQAMRSKMTSSLFAANYELKHISDENMLFTNPVIDSGANTKLIYDGIAHIDASYGGKDGTAFTIIKRHEDNIYVYGELHAKHVDDVLLGFENKRELYRAGRLYTEKNADKGYLHQRIKAPKTNYHESMNKYVKISTYLKEEWDNIIFIKDTCPDYIGQIIDYNENSSLDDAPDSLSSLIRVINEPGIKVKTFRGGI